MNCTTNSGGDGQNSHHGAEFEEVDMFSDNYSTNSTKTKLAPKPKYFIMKYLLVFEIGGSSFEDAILGLWNNSDLSSSNISGLEKNLLDWNFSTFPNLQCIEEVSELTMKDKKNDSLDFGDLEFGGVD